MLYSHDLREWKWFEHSNEYDLNSIYGSDAVLEMYQVSKLDNDKAILFGGKVGSYVSDNA